MNPTVLLLIALGGVALLLLLVLKFKFHPFVALLLVSIIVPLAAGISPKDLVSTIELGMGSVLGHIAIIIALGAMVGRIIELSGGAQSLATTLIERFGNHRTPLALTAAGFLLGIPVFFEVGVIILMPLAYGVAKAAKKPLLIYALPMCAAMLTVHAFLPPHPGPVAVAGLFGADIGRILLWGLPLTAVLTLCSLRTLSACQRPSAPTVSWHASAQAVSSTPTPDAALPVHAAQMWIDSASIVRNMPSGSGISACAAPSTAQLTACGAACRRNAAGRGRRLLVKRSAHCVAWGTAPSARSLSGERLSPPRPSSCANTLSLTRTETARTRWRSAAATGSAMVAQRRVIKASMCRSSPVSPITDGINSARYGRPSSEVWSLTRRATDASNECVQAG
jgi:hypothetical protein